MKRKLQNGDLETITLVTHDREPKRFAIMGKFRGDSKEYILARLGEGIDDALLSETIETNAETTMEALRDLYAVRAMKRRKKNES